MQKLRNIQRTFNFVAIFDSLMISNMVAKMDTLKYIFKL